MVPWDRPDTTGATAAPGYLTSGALQSVWVTFSSSCRQRSPGKAVKTRTRALVALRGGIRAGKLITALTSPWDRPGATGAIAAPGYHKFHVL